MIKIIKIENCHNCPFCNNDNEYGYSCNLNGLDYNEMTQYRDTSIPDKCELKTTAILAGFNVIINE